jgi:hypothetical protein
MTIYLLKISPKWLKAHFVKWSVARLTPDQRAAFYNRVHRRKSNPKFADSSDLAIRLDALRTPSNKAQSGAQTRVYRLWLFFFVISFVGNLYFAMHGAKLAFGQDSLHFGWDWIDELLGHLSVSFYLALIFEIGAIALLRVKSPLGLLPLIVVMFTIGYPVYSQFTTGMQVIEKAQFNQADFDRMEKESSAKLATKKARYRSLERKLSGLDGNSKSYDDLILSMQQVEREILDYTEMINRIDRLQLEHHSTLALALFDPNAQGAKRLISQKQKLNDLITISAAQAFMRFTLFLMSIGFFARAFPYVKPA